MEAAKSSDGGSVSFGFGRRSKKSAKTSARLGAPHTLMLCGPWRWMYFPAAASTRGASSVEISKNFEPLTICSRQAVVEMSQMILLRSP